MRFLVLSDTEAHHHQLFYTIAMSFSGRWGSGRGSRALAAVEGVDSVETQPVFDPLWSPGKMSDEAKFLPGVYG